MPKTLKERLDWLYKNDPIFKAEKDEVDRIEQMQKQKQKQKEALNETSNRHTEIQNRPRN